MANIAVIVGPEFEDSELDVPCRALRDAGHEVTFVGTEAGKRVEGKRGKSSVEIQLAASDAHPEDFDGLLIPGGHSPDNLRTNPGAVKFVERFINTDKPIAAICHGPQLLIEAKAVKGRTMTSWPSVRADLLNAGAEWIDEEVVVDGRLITSRKPEDLSAFSDALLEQLEAPPRNSKQVAAR
jgi:protease I